MTTATAVLASLAFLGWLIYRALKGKPVSAHTVAYGISVITGISTLAFFLNMDIPQMVKIISTIVIGVILIFIAAAIQRRRQLRGG